MKILVTGGAGFIGSNLVERLVQEGHEIVVLDNFALGRMENLSAVKNSITLVKGDIRNEDDVNAAAEGCEIIFNEAAASSSPMFMNNLRESVAVNVDGFVNILNAARKFDAEKIIYPSTSSIYGNLPPPLKEDMNVCPPNFYSVTKHLNESIARVFSAEYGISTIGFRYMSVYGPKEEGKGIYAKLVSQFLWAMRKGQSPVIYGNGSQTRDFVYVKDVVDANMLAIGSNIKSDVFNIGSGLSRSLNELVELLNMILEKHIIPRYVEMPVKSYINSQLGGIEKIRTHLNYRPRYSIERGIRDIISLS